MTNIERQPKDTQSNPAQTPNKKGVVAGVNYRTLISAFRVVEGSETAPSSCGENLSEVAFGAMEN